MGRGGYAVSSCCSRGVRSRGKVEGMRCQEEQGPLRRPGELPSVP